MSTMASQITGVSFIYSSVCTGAEQIKHQISALLAFVRIIHRWPLNAPHKGSVMRKMLPWWRHQYLDVAHPMMTSWHEIPSVLLECPHNVWVLRSFDASFVINPTAPLKAQSSCLWLGASWLLCDDTTNDATHHIFYVLRKEGHKQLQHCLSHCSEIVIMNSFNVHRIAVLKGEKQCFFYFNSLAPRRS